MTSTRVLAAVVALQLVAETSLTPYWPQLLDELFAVNDLAATGAFLTACRLAGLLALPLWALAARHWPLPRLLVVALLGCAVLDLALALAPSLLLFTLASAGVVATGSALVLAYPALVAVADGDTGDRLRAVLVGVGVFHAASLVATPIGAGIVSLPEPRVGLAAFAVADLVLALLVWRCVGAGTGDGGRVTATPGTTEALVAAGVASAAGPRASRLALPVLGVLLLAFLVDTGLSVPRPFFTELVEQEGGSLGAAATLFLLPSLGALLVLPLARRAVSRLGAAALPGAASACAVALAVHAAAPDALGLVAAARFGLGAGLGLLTVALDLRVFRAVGTDGPGFALVETARATALLAAPVLAGTAAGVDLVLPLVVGAALLALAAAVSARGATHPDLEAPRALVPVR